MEGTAPVWSTTFHTVVLPQCRYNHVAEELYHFLNLWTALRTHVVIVVLWEHYSMKGSAPLWSSTFHTVVLKGGALQYAREWGTFLTVVLHPGALQ